MATEMGEETDRFKDVPAVYTRNYGRLRGGVFAISGRILALTVTFQCASCMLLVTSQAKNGLLQSPDLPCQACCYCFLTVLARPAINRVYKLGSHW